MESNQAAEITIGQIAQNIDAQRRSIEMMELKQQETMSLILNIIQNTVTMKNDLEALKHDSVRGRIQYMKSDATIAVMKNSLERLETKIEDLEKITIDFHGDSLEAINILSSHTDAEFRQTRSEMASKDHLDRKVDGLEIGVLGQITKIDKKDTALVEALEKKNIVSVSDSQMIIAMSPFPVHV